MTVSVFYHHVLNAAQQRKKSISEILDLISSAGISCVEQDLYNFSEETDHCALIKAAGMKTACINAHYSMENSFDEAQAQAHIEAAIRSGANMILVVPGYLSQEDGIALGKVIHDKEDTYSFLNSCPNALKMADSLDRITKMADEKGVCVTVEDFDNTASPLSGLYSLMWFLDRIPKLKCTFDTGNFVTYDDDVINAWNLLKDRVVHIHCKDRGASPVAVGDGYLPLSELLGTIAKSGYKGAFAIEHYGAEDQLTCMLRSASFIQNAIS